MNDYVTLEEAERRLEQVRPRLDAARRAKREIETIAAGCNYDGALLYEVQPKLKTLLRQLSEHLDALEDLGCYVKDLDIGLIDFLSTFEGRDIFLCWKLGEEHINYWHEINEGFGSRQDILDMEQLEFGIEPQDSE